MEFLAKLSVRFWYFFSLAYCYVIWNPYYSLFDFARGNYDPAIKTIAVLLALAVLALYLVEGHRSLNVFAIVLFFAIIGSVMWLAFNNGWRFAYADWWGQWVVAALMTLALQGGRMYRSMTGRVPVGTGNTDGHHGHHAN